MFITNQKEKRVWGGRKSKLKITYILFLIFKFFPDLFYVERIFIFWWLPHTAENENCFMLLILIIEMRSKFAY